MSRFRFMASIAVASLSLCATARAETDKKTERTWKAKCASCHGQTGKADTEKGKQMKMEDMTSAAYQKRTDDAFKKAILDGIHTETGGVKQDMPGFSKELEPAQVDALVAYIRTFK